MQGSRHASEEEVVVYPAIADIGREYSITLRKRSQQG
jgi:hypothetical protein